MRAARKVAHTKQWHCLIVRDKCVENLQATLVACTELEEQAERLKQLIPYRLYLDAAGSNSYSIGQQHNFVVRSEERRVGKECRSRWSPYH